MFTGGTAVFVFLVFIFLAIFFNKITRINLGICGFVAACMLGCFFYGMSPSKVIGLMSTSIFILIFCATTFFGYVAQQNVFEGVVDRILYVNRDHPQMMPFILYVAGVVIGCLGAGSHATPLIISPIAFAFARSIGIHPVMAGLITFLSSYTAGFMPWNDSMATHIGQLEAVETVYTASSAYASVIPMIIVNTFNMLVILVVFYFILGCNKKCKKDCEYLQNLKMPEPFTKDQKTTLIIVVCVIGTIALGSILKMLFPKNAVIKFVSRCFDVRFTTLLGACIMHALKLGTWDATVKKIPWNTIIMVLGMSALASLAKEIGVVDTLANLLTSGTLPKGLILPIWVLVAAFLGIIAGANAVGIPLLLPMIEPLAEATGWSAAALGGMCIVAVCAVSMSPISTGGNMALLGGTREESDRCFNGMFAAVGVSIALCVIEAIIPIYPWLFSIFVE